jgi:hypothetical protein
MWQVIYNITKKWWDRHKGHGLDRTSVPVWPNVRQKKKTFRQLWNSPDIHKAQCCNKSFDISYHWHWTSIIFLTGYRHFHLKKGKVKQGFIYENAQKKVLENCIFCPGKSLKSPWFCSTKKCMNPDCINCASFKKMQLNFLSGVKNIEQIATLPCVVRLFIF